MSRYTVDKLLREIVLDNEVARAYQHDRATLLAERDFTPEERRALMEFDYRALYGSGVHPFLLNGFVMKVWPGDRAKAGPTYRAAIAEFGYPDFAT